MWQLTTDRTLPTCCLGTLTSLLFYTSVFSDIFPFFFWSLLLFNYHWRTCSSRIDVYIQTPMVQFALMSFHWSCPLFSLKLYFALWNLVMPLPRYWGVKLMQYYWFRDFYSTLTVVVVISCHRKHKQQTTIWFKCWMDGTSVKLLLLHFLFSFNTLSFSLLCLSVSLSML